MNADALTPKDGIAVSDTELSTEGLPGVPGAGAVGANIGSTPRYGAQGTNTYQAGQLGYGSQSFPGSPLGTTIGQTGQTSFGAQPLGGSTAGQAFTTGGTPGSAIGSNGFSSSIGQESGSSTTALGSQRFGNGASSSGYGLPGATTSGSSGHLRETNPSGESKGYKESKVSVFVYIPMMFSLIYAIDSL